MLRALWFLCQILVIVLAGIWLVERPGDVTFTVFDYTLTMRTGLFLIGGIVAVWLLGVLWRMIDTLVSFPAWMGSWGRTRRKAKAMRQLVQGYSLLAAGEAPRALKLSLKVRDVLPEVRAMALLLEAQASRQLGRQASAAAAYRQLMKDKDAGFLGLKGLLGQSIENGQTEQALDYAHKAVKMHPKAGWGLKTLYDLQIATRDFEAAGQTLRKAERLGVIDKERAVSDNIAMLMFQAQRAEETGREDEVIRYAEKAVRLDSGFTPAVSLLAGALLQKGKTRRAQSLIETAWKKNPHPALIPLWDRLAPKNTSRDMLKRMRWYEALVALNPSAPAGLLAAAAVALEENLLGEARGYLARAEKEEVDADFYRMALKIERAGGGDETIIRAIEEKLFKAPPARVWTCRQTGAIYDQWSPIARPHGAFNTIIWGLPKPPAVHGAALQTDRLDDPMMIGAF